MDKPEGYPYTTVRSDFSGHRAVLMDWSPQGFEQTSDALPPVDDYIEAKRQAVQMAKVNGCAFKVPVHG